MSKAKMGALVKYCAHDGCFVADVHKVGNVNVVRANGPVSPANLTRTQLLNPTHQLSDFPTQGFWRPDIGVFVVPEDQVTELKPGGKR